MNLNIAFKISLWITIAAAGFLFARTTAQMIDPSGKQQVPTADRSVHEVTRQEALSKPAEPALPAEPAVLTIDQKIAKANKWVGKTVITGFGSPWGTPSNGKINVYAIDVKRIDAMGTRGIQRFFFVSMPNDCSEFITDSRPVESLTHEELERCGTALGSWTTGDIGDQGTELLKYATSRLAGVRAK